MEVDSPKYIPNKIFPEPKFEGYCDLRKFHSSLSARLHCQHGITYFRDNYGEWNESNRSFDNLIIATVKFPNKAEFKVGGPLFNKDFLFPGPEIDNTYKLLKKDKFTKLLREIEIDHNLQEGDLGEIWSYSF